MIIIPELETVVLLVPRTGTGALRRAIAKRWSQSFMPYRHMEADGIPLGYDRWRRVGVVREPVERLWSLYKFLRDFGGDHDPAYVTRMRASVLRPFADWIVLNDTVFTSPYDSAGLGRYWPGYTVRHPLPETRKSQWLTLRPDLGTEVFRYSDIRRLHAVLDVEPITANATASEEMPPLNALAQDHIERFFAWDLQATATPPVALDHAGFAMDRVEVAA